MRRQDRLATGKSNTTLRAIAKTRRIILRCNGSNPRFRTYSAPSEFRKTEAALKGSEEKFRVMFDSSHDLMSIADGEGKTIWANPAWQNVLGYSPKTQGNPFEKIHPDDLKKVVNAWLALKNEDKSITNLAYRYSTADGSYVFLETTARKAEILGEDFFYVAARNITERKRAEEALKQSEEKLRTIFENANDEIVLLEGNGTIVDVNRKIEDIFGYRPDEVIGKNFAEISFFAPEDMPNVMELFKRAVAGNPSELRELQARRKDGTVVFIEANTRVIRRDRAIRGIIVIVRDITERRKLEEDRRRAERLEATTILARSIGHDINNILAAITGCTNIARITLDRAINSGVTEMSLHELNELLAEVDKASGRGAALVKQLMGTNTHMATDSKPSSVPYMLRASARIAFVFPSIKVEYHFSDDIWPVMVQESRISRVFDNLLSNAVEAIKAKKEDKGKIEIRAENVIRSKEARLRLCNGRYVRISITDNGVGIREDRLPQIFDWEFSTRKREGGSGIGLPISVATVKDHGGEITVESKEGVGTTFHVLLPAFEEDQKKAELDRRLEEFCRATK
jgi:PAS domain S-box-containing protein